MEGACHAVESVLAELGVREWWNRMNPKGLNGQGFRVSILGGGLQVVILRSTESSV